MKTRHMAGFLAHGISIILWYSRVMTDGLLQKELGFFKKNQAELVKKYEGKFLVIKDQSVQGAYDSEMEAYSTAKKKFELGTFLIQHCVPGEGSYTQTFQSRVIFA